MHRNHQALSICTTPNVGMYTNISLTIKPHIQGVAKELTEVLWPTVKSEVRSVETEQERWYYRLWRLCAALQPVSEVVNNSGQHGVHPSTCISLSFSAAWRAQWCAWLWIYQRPWFSPCLSASAGGSDSWRTDAEYESHIFQCVSLCSPLHLISLHQSCSDRQAWSL